MWCVVWCGVVWCGAAWCGVVLWTGRLKRLDRTTPHHTTPIAQGVVGEGADNALGAPQAAVCMDVFWYRHLPEEDHRALC